MILINFYAPLKPDLIKQSEQLLREPIDRVVTFVLQLDSDALIGPQFKQAMKTFPLSLAEMRAEPVAVILPNASYLAALLLAEIHARLDYFPPILRIRMQSYSLPPRQEVVELLNLQEIEDSTRGIETN